MTVDETPESIEISYRSTAKQVKLTIREKLIRTQQKIDCPSCKSKPAFLVSSK
jgi:hypothetical protein